MELRIIALEESKQFGGTGAGLSIVQRVITRHGGRCGQKGDQEKEQTSSSLCHETTVTEKKKLPPGKHTHLQLTNEQQVHIH